MIISCNNCDKNFDISSYLIPDEGRLLQCSGCNHKWFFKKEIIKKPLVLAKNQDPESITFLDNVPKQDLDINKITDKEQIKINEDKIIDKIPNNFLKKKKSNILNLFYVFIISFVALIIVIDTFKYPITKIIPNIEFLLYNLYESIKDVILFVKDLI